MFARLSLLLQVPFPKIDMKESNLRSLTSSSLGPLPIVLDLVKLLQAPQLRKLSLRCEKVMISDPHGLTVKLHDWDIYIRTEQPIASEDRDTLLSLGIRGLEVDASLKRITCRSQLAEGFGSIHDGDKMSCSALALSTRPTFGAAKTMQSIRSRLEHLPQQRISDFFADSFILLIILLRHYILRRRHLMGLLR